MCIFREFNESLKDDKKETNTVNRKKENGNKSKKERREVLLNVLTWFANGNGYACTSYANLYTRDGNNGE